MTQISLDTIKIPIIKPTHKPFLIKRGREYVDIITDDPYVEFTDIPYEQCTEGLCNQYGKLILKNIGYPERVMIGKQRPKDLSNIKSITVNFLNSHKKNDKWTFEPLDISEINKCLKQELDIKNIACIVCAPVEACENVIYKIGGDRYGIKRNKIERRRKDSSSKFARQRKDGS